MFLEQYICLIHNFFTGWQSQQHEKTAKNCHSRGSGNPGNQSFLNQSFRVYIRWTPSWVSILLFIGKIEITTKIEEKPRTAAPTKAGVQPIYTLDCRPCALRPFQGIGQSPSAKLGWPKASGSAITIKRNLFSWVMVRLRRMSDCFVVSPEIETSISTPRNDQVAAFWFYVSYYN